MSDAPDFRLAADIMRHRKTRRLIKRLGSDAFVSLITLMGYVRMNRSDGVLTGLDPDDIEDEAEWGGKVGQFFIALREIGWLDEDGGVFAIHDWAERNPWATGAADRSASARHAGYVKQHKIGRHATPKAGCPLCATEIQGLTEVRPAPIRTAPRTDPQSGPHDSAVPLSDSVSVPVPSPSPTPLLPSDDSLTNPVRWDSWISGFWKVVEDFWPKPLMGNPRTAFEALVANQALWARVKADGLDWLVTIFRNMDASWKATSWPLDKYPLIANVFRSQSEHWMRHTPEAKAVTVKASAAKSGLCTVDGCDEYLHGETDLCTDHFLEADR